MFTVLYVLIALYIVTFIILRLLRKPEELAIYTLIMSSSLPVIVHGNALSYGPKGASIRFEYVLFFVGIFLATWKWVKHYPPSRSSLSKVVLIMFFVYLFSIPITIYWNKPFGIGVLIRLVETFLYFFIIVRLTGREHIPKLVNALIAVGTLVAGILFIATTSGSITLLNLINPTGRYIERGGQFFGQGATWLGHTVWALPTVGVMPFVLCLLKKRRRFLWGTLSLFFMIRTISMGQRFPVLALLFGYIFILFMLPKIKLHGEIKFHKALVILTIICLTTYALFAYTPVLRHRYEYLMDRVVRTKPQFESERQFMGAFLAKQELDRGGVKAWLFGYGGFMQPRIGPLDYDINTYMLAIYRFGVVGLIVLLGLVVFVIKQSWYVLKNVPMVPEEVAVVSALIVFVFIAVSGSFARNFILSSNFNTLSWFILWMSWMEVIYRDRRTALRNNQERHAGQ